MDTREEVVAMEMAVGMATVTEGIEGAEEVTEVNEGHPNQRPLLCLSPVKYNLGEPPSPSNRAISLLNRYKIYSQN
jgi:hypothetical protein